MLSPFVKVSDLDYLMLHIIETKGLHEGMFSDTEQPFIFHELLEIVNHLRLFGPVKSLMCFSGERTMKAIGDVVPDGGQKYILTVADRYVAKESAASSNLKSYEDSKEFFTDNAGFYSGKVLKLTGRFTTVCLNFNIKDMLFNSVQEFLATQEIGNLAVKSPFVRLYFTYEVLVKSYTDMSWVTNRPDSFPVTFSHWIHELNCLRQSEDICSDTAKGLVNGVLFDLDPTLCWRDKDVEKLDDIAHDIMSTLVDCGKVFLTDFDGIIFDLAVFAPDAILRVANAQPIAAFTRAVVKGIQFNARGQKYAEDTLLLEDLSGTNRVGLSKKFMIQNEDNKLKSSWFPSFQLNSWCKVTDFYVHYTNRNVKQVKRKLYVGQLNYFFRMFVPSDLIVNGVAMANIVLRNVGYSPVHGCYQIKNMMNDVDSYYAHKQFVPLSYIDSTALAVIAMDKHELPMMSPDATLRKAKDRIKDYPLVFSNQNFSDVERLDLVELHKDRVHLQYKSVEFDPEGINKMEECILEHHKL